MKVLTAFLLCHLLLTGRGHAGLAIAGDPGVGAPAGVVGVSQYAACDGKTDDTTATQNALAAAAGRTLGVPAGCKLLVAGPRAGNAALTVPDGTTIRCEDHGAGFYVARRACAGGRYPGAACAGDDGCPGGGTCVHDAAAGAFAPDAADRYTVLKNASGARFTAIQGCSIWTNQLEPTYRCRGGTKNGLPCLQYCQGAPAMACDADADCAPAPGATGTVCHGGVRGGRPCSTDDTDPSTGCPGASCPGCCHGTCRDLAACTGGGGTCDGHPISPAGPGKIDAIDFGTASDALIDDVWVHDHQGGTSFAVKGTLRASSNGKKSVSYPVALSWAPFPIVDGGPDTGAAVAGRVESCDLVAKTTGLSVVGRDTKVRDNRIAVNGEGASYGIDAHTAGGYAATIEGNTVTGFRTYGIWAYAASNVIGNWLYSDSPTCTGLYVEAYHDNVGSNYVQVKGQCVAGNPSTALNVTFAGNRCFGGGPQVHIKGPGWIVTDNYLAWAGGGEVIRYSGGGHPLIANNLVHTSGATDVCHGGARDGQPCSSDTARAPAVCPGSTCPGCCYSSVSGIRFVDTGTPFSSVNIAGNSFLHVGIGVDMSGVTTTGVGDVSITGNQFTSVGRTAVRFPSVPTLVTGALVGNNHFASGVATTENWDWRMGVLSLNGPLEPSDDDVTTLAYVNNRSGGTIAAGDAVEVDAGGDDAVRLARAGTGTAVAIMLEPCASGSVCKIARAGTTACNVEAGASVGRGDRLKVGDTAGKMTVAAAVEPAVAVATTAGAGSVRCLVGALAPGGSAARPIVFTQQVAPGCRYGSDSSRAVTLRGFPVTGLTGDRTAVLTVTLQQSDQAAGSEKFRFWIYDNGATGCPASCTAATPSGRDCGQACGALAPAAGLDHAMNGGEGQSTVVTMTWVDPQTRAGVNNYCLVAAEEGGAAPHALDSVQLVAVEYP